MHISDAISYRFQAPSKPIDPASKAYKSLCAVDRVATSQKTKERIVENLLDTGFDINAAIHEENGVKVNLLDLAIAQEDEAFILFLIQEKDATPLFCNENSKSNPRMKEFRDFRATNLLGPSRIPITSGKPTPATEINANATQVSLCKLWGRLYDIAKIPLNMLASMAGGLMYGLIFTLKGTAKALACTVGGVMFGLSIFANLAIPRIIYLALSAPVLVAWTVGYRIDKFCGNKELPVTQGLGEFAATPAYALNSLMALSRYTLGLVSRAGAELMYFGYKNDGIFYTQMLHTKIIDDIAFSLSDLKRNNTPVDLGYEKIFGQRGPSFGERIGRPDSIAELCDLVRKFNAQNMNHGFSLGLGGLPMFGGLRV